MCPYNCEKCKTEPTNCSRCIECGQFWAEANFSKSHMRIWQHRETGVRCWKDSSPGERWYPIQMVYEDRLPKDMPRHDYDAWFAESLVIDGVRVGPLYSQLHPGAA